MKLEEISKKLKTTLELEDSPVGVKLFKVGEELPEIAGPAEPIPYCASIVRARKGESVLQGKDKHGCLLGAANLGLINVPEKISSGEAHSSMGLFSSAAAASKTISEVPRIDPETTRATLVFPLEKAPVEPEVIILHVNPDQAMWVALALNYNKGGRHFPSFACVGGTCGDITAIPYLRNVPNFSTGDFGGRKRRAPEEMIVGIPVTLIEEVVNNLEKLGCPR
jgi:uncharacterized protein (DUF169 family)